VRLLPRSSLPLGRPVGVQRSAAILGPALLR
jgi:hypothetical protein